MTSGINPKLALQAIEQIEARYQQWLVAPYSERISDLTNYLAQDLNRAAKLQKKFRGFLEPFARALVTARIAATLAAIYVTGREQPELVEFQDDPISIVWNLPPAEAIRYFMGKRIITRDDFDRLTKRERQYAFTVSRVSEQKLLEDIHERILNNLKSGQPRQKLEKELQQLLPDFARHRIELIANQNLRQATMQGRFEQMWRTRQLLPYVQWKTMGDDRVRPEHRALHNQIWRLEQIPFWPPLGFNCRCWVIQLSGRKIQGRQVIADPGLYNTIDGDRILVARVDDATQYFLNGAPMKFELSQKPQSLFSTPAPPSARAQAKAPRTLAELESAVQAAQAKYRGDKQPIRQIDWDWPGDPDQPSTIADWYNGRIRIRRDISPKIQQALDKLARGEPLSFDETDALQTLWHEIGHSRGSQDFWGYDDPLKPDRRFEIEVVNEMHARLRLEQFVRSLGFDPSLLSARGELAIGKGYQWWLIEMRRALEAAGIGQLEATAFFEKLNLQKPTVTYLDSLLDFIGERLQLPQAHRNRLRQDIVAELRDKGGISDFRWEIEFLARALKIKPAHW